MTGPTIKETAEKLRKVMEEHVIFGDDRRVSYDSDAWASAANPLAVRRLLEGFDQKDALIASQAAVIEAQRRAMTDAVYGLSKARIWGGMDWHYNPLNPLHYRPVMLALEACVNAPLASQPACHCHQCIKDFDLRDSSGLLPLSSAQMIVCPTCGNKRCPKANDHRNTCTGSNEAGQPGSAYPALQPSAEPARPLTDEALLKCVRETVHGEILRLTRDVGAYEVTEPTPTLRKLAFAIVRAAAASASTSG